MIFGIHSPHLNDAFLFKISFNRELLTSILKVKFDLIYDSKDG